MKQTIILLLLSLTLSSCSDPLDQKISEDDSYEYLDEICEDGKYKVKCPTLKDRYTDVLYLKERGGKYKAYIVEDYGKTFEQLTFRDLLENKRK